MSVLVCVYVYVYLLLVLFLQRPLTDTLGLKNISKEMCFLLSRSFSKYYLATNQAVSGDSFTVRHIH